MLSLEEVNKTFRYEPISGMLFWKVGKWKDKRAGTRSNVGGYRHVRVGKKYFYEHRIIMLMVHGELPKGMQVDHLSHDRSDNRLCNLRFVSHTDNGRNTKLHSTNTTGVIGTTFVKRTGKYMAQMEVNGKHLYLGCFKTLEEAAAARLEAEKLYGFHENHGI